MIHYIPLKVKTITRDEQGNKVIGQFPNWRNAATHRKVATFQEIQADRASAIVVGPSHLKVVDVDDNDLFEEILAINEQLASQYQCKLIVKSDTKGGHLYYNDAENKLDKFLGNPQDGAKIHKIDYQTGNRLIFTWINNDTKELVTLQAETPEDLTSLPDAIANYIIAYKLNNDIQTMEETLHTKQTEVKTVNHLAPLINNFLNQTIREDIRLNSLNTFLSIVTPKEFKKILKPKDGIDLHPDTIPPNGGAHNYLVSIAGVLMHDESVDSDLYIRCLTYINNLFSDPDSTLYTIINRDTRSQEFRYNQNWKTKTLTLTGKDGNTAYKIYQVMDTQTETYMFVDEVAQTVKIGKKNAIIGIIHSLMTGGKQIKGSNIADRCLSVELINDPLKPFGLIDDTNNFNIFKRNKVQQIFYSPEDYEHLASTHPTTILNYLTHIIGNEKKRDMFLRFLKRKLSTHQYSPLIFVLWGVPGSGKNTLTQKILAPLVEGRDIINLTVDNLRDKFNSVFKERDFLVLDEVHTLPQGQKREFINLINALSGKAKVAERKMFSSYMEQFNNEFTILMTTNKPTEVTTEANDRRIVIFRSDKTLSDALGMSDDAVIQRLEDEIYSFAYYLSQLEPLDHVTYVKNYPWIEADVDYEEFMTESKSLAYRLYKSLHTRNYKSLFDILFDCDITDDEFLECVTKEPRGYALRLLNSKESYSAVPALGNHPNLALKQENIVYELRNLAKEYKANFMYVEAIEYDEGVKTGNKKTSYRLDVDLLPEHIKIKLLEKGEVDELETE